MKELGYYFKNENETVQLLSNTNRKFFARMEKELDMFLNGLIEINT